MLRTGEQYRESLRDGRQVWINGDKVADVTKHASLKPIIDIRARIYDMAHEQGSKELMSYRDAATGEENNIGYANIIPRCHARTCSGHPWLKQAWSQRWILGTSPRMTRE